MEEKNKGGQPTLFKDSLLDKAEEYIKFFTGELESKLRNDVEVIPTIEGMCIYLGVSRSAVYAWEEKAKDNLSSEINARYVDILDRLRAVQASLLINNGLVGKFSAPVTKMMMTKHGYSDKVETDIISSDGSMTPSANLTNDQVAIIAESLKEKI